MRLGVLFICLAMCASAFAASTFEGVWDGTFKSQPSELKPDGSYPEGINRFVLNLRPGKRISGWFDNLERVPAARRSIGKAKMFGNRLCFDIVDRGQDMRWCVSVRRDHLTGVWSEGPQGGPLLDGMGVGARVFAIAARRVH